MRFKEIIFIMIIIFQSSGCKNNTAHSEIIIPKIAGVIDLEEKKNVEEQSIVGNYISEIDPVDKKSCDKIRVLVSMIGNDKLQLKVIPRIEKERHSLIFEAVVYKNNDSLFTTLINGKRILINITNKILSIKPEKPEDLRALTTCCSWGSNLAGSYKKIDSTLSGR
ncbi:hypothetical protein GFO_2647 [Christiangramia forsetii KT0803]|uniref:Uncharacterized protein n=3 Tax=Christiangramia forsetii TaxID=411153 RepID=A0M4Q8_CHRFK|nr:hypothetical protein GFO_2647 [Christiangramia forsetii KT0803]